MRITKLVDGSLQMSATPGDQKLAKKLLRITELNMYAKEAAFIAQTLHPIYQQTAPASLNTVTSAPLITDGIDYWGFMDYQIENFLDRVSLGLNTFWQKG